MKNKKAKGRQLLSGIGSTIVLIFLIFLAFLLIVNREKLSIDNLTRALNYRNLGSSEQTDEFQFSDHNSNTFALLGDGIAVASASGLRYYDKTGQRAYSSLFSMDNPVIMSAGSQVLAYDIGGTSLVIGDEQGIVREMEQDSAIFSADLNAAGFLAVCTERVGAKGVVTVYNGDGNPVYETVSRTGYLVKAAVSADNRHLAVLTHTENGGRIEWFLLSQENDPVEQYRFNEELFFDFWFTSGSAVAAISDSRVAFISGSGKQQNEYTYSSAYLRAYSRDTDVVLYVSPYKMSTGGMLVRVTPSGADELEIEQNVIDLSLKGKYLAVLTDSSLDVYRNGLTRYAEIEETENMTRVLMREDGTVIRMSSYRAKLIVP